MALMLATARRIPRIDRESARRRVAARDLLTQLLGKTLGVFGTGKIGARVITIAKALGMDVLAYSARGDSAAVAASALAPRPRKRFAGTRT
jgi:D-lactate dehydrogenase